MKKITQLLLGAALCWVAFQTTGCALSAKKKDQGAVSKIKTAAITSFTADLPASRKLEFNLNSGKLGGAAGGSMINQEMPETDQLLEKVISAFSAKMKWKVLSAEQIKTSPKYQETYKKTMEGWHNRMPPGEGVNRYVVNGVMDYDSARILDVAGREQLMNDLKVDALVAVWSMTHLSGTSIMGIGNRKPQTNILVTVYARGVEEPIWRESLQGDEITESVGSTGFIDEKKTASLVLKAADGALSRLGSIE